MRLNGITIRNKRHDSFIHFEVTFGTVYILDINLIGSGY